MNRDIVVVWLAAALALSAAAVAVDASLAFAGGVTATLVLLILLGAMKGPEGDPGPFAPWLALAGTAWLLAFAAMHLLPQTVEEAGGAGGLWLGLPPATAAMVYGLWIVPLFLATLPYALHFDRFTLTEEQLARLEEATGTSTRAPNDESNGGTNGETADAWNDGGEEE